LLELVATLFSIDSIFNIVSEHPCVALELILQLAGVKATWLLTRGTFNTLRAALRQFEMIFIVRNLRIGSLLAEVKMFSILYEFMFRMSKPLVVQFAALYFCFYCYAVVGNFWLGGRVTMESAQVEDGGVPGLYYLMNFNDLASGMVTLFAFMIVNNWVYTV